MESRTRSGADTVGASAGQAQDALSLTIVDFGIYNYRKDARPNPNWEVRPLQSICHVATTRRVPTDDGFQFGFRFHLEGPKRGTIVNLVQTISWPVDGIGVEGEADESSTCFQVSDRDIAKWPQLAVQRVFPVSVRLAGGSS